MPNPLDDFDLGADFEEYAVGLAPVTVTSVDPDDPATVLATAEGVPAARLVTTADTVSARTGEVGVTKCEFWLRRDRLGFLPKPRDQVAEADGTVWLMDSVEMMGGGGPNAIAKCGATLSRSH